MTHGLAKTDFRKTPDMYRVLAIFICLFCFAFSSKTYAQNTSSSTLILSDKQQEHYLSPYISIYNDNEKTLDARTVVTQQSKLEKTANNSGTLLDLRGNTNKRWLSFNLINRSKTNQWIIDFGSSFNGRFGLASEIESYAFNYETRALSKNKEIENNAIKLFVPANKKIQLLIAIEANNNLPMTIPLKINNINNYTKPTHKLLFSIVTIFLFGMAFFFSAIALMRKQYHYFLMSAYFIILAALLFIQNNFVAISLPVIGNALIPFMSLIVSLSGYSIAAIFWHISDASSFTKKIYITPIVLSIISFFIIQFSPLNALSAAYFLPALCMLLLIPIISIYKSQKNNDDITAFMFGGLIFLFGACITLLNFSSIMQPLSTAINAYWFALLPQTVFFVIAAYNQINRKTNHYMASKTVEINETESVSRLRESKESMEHERLLKVIEQERKVLGQLRKSEAKRSEEMRKAKEDADLANKAKSAFLAVVTHEIRTPMTGIMGMVRLLLDTSLGKEQKEFAQTIQDSSDAMLALLNDILDFEKIEQGKMTFENISFDLHRLIKGVSRLMNGHAVQKDIDLEIQMGGNLPRYVMGDPNRLRQVLLNLTGNAVKFTEKGTVTITVERINETIKDGCFEIYFAIKDSGIGISEEAQKNLFNPFAQADKSISRKFGGTGLGLAISKGLIENMGSSININSKEGLGSTFFFTLQMKASSEEDQQQILEEGTNSQLPSHEDTNIKSINILIVDDNETNRKVIRGFLKKQNHFMEDAEDAQVAFKKLAQKKYDLILMDIEMPGLSGDEATKKLRQSHDPHLRNIPVIAITGNVMPNHIDRFNVAGMNGYLAKPIDPEKLNDLVKRAAMGEFNNKPVNSSGAMENWQNDVSNKSKQDSKEQEDLTPTIDRSQSETKKANKDEAELVADVFKTDTMDTLKEHMSHEELKEMLDDVMTKTSEIIASMNIALSQQNTEELSARGHELKGMAGNFGLMELSRQAAEIESKGKMSASLILNSLVEPLTDMQKRAQKALDQWLDTNKD